VNFAEYSPRLRLGEYSPMFTSPLANNGKILVKIPEVKMRSAFTLSRVTLPLQKKVLAN